jgi:epoxide hydrolase-like predicted phosphatase
MPLNMPQIQAVVFDCFGVVLLDQQPKVFDQYFGEDESGDGSTRESFRTQADALNRRCDLGLITFAELVPELAELAREAQRVEVDEEAFYEELAHTPPNEELLAYIETVLILQRGFQVAMLSNTGQRSWITESLGVKRLDRLFNPVVLSCEEGHTKPDLEIYKQVVKWLGVSATHCVMTDDRQHYLRPGERLGMRTIHYTGFEEFKAQMQHYFP